MHTCMNPYICTGMYIHTYSTWNFCNYRLVSILIMHIYYLIFAKYNISYFFGKPEAWIEIESFHMKEETEIQKD